MLSSHDKYLNCVIFACLNEYESHQNVFESFIRVCALLQLFNDGLLTMTGMDFCALNSDVFLVLYENVMKSTFYEEGGSQQLVECIQNHRFLSWKWNRKDPDLFDNPSNLVIQDDAKKEFVKERSRHGFRGTDAHLNERNATSTLLAQKVLASTSVELPNLANIAAKDLKASKNEDIEVKGGKERVVDTNAGLVDLNVNENWDDTNYERIIQAVIRHNRSRNSDHTNLDNPIQKEFRNV